MPWLQRLLALNQINPHEPATVTDSKTLPVDSLLDSSGANHTFRPSPGGIGANVRHNRQCARLQSGRGLRASLHRQRKRLWSAPLYARGTRLADACYDSRWHICVRHLVNRSPHASRELAKALRRGSSSSNSPASCNNVSDAIAVAATTRHVRDSRTDLFKNQSCSPRQQLQNFLRLTYPAP